MSELSRVVCGYKRSSAHPPEPVNITCKATFTIIPPEHELLFLLWIHSTSPNRWDPDLLKNIFSQPALPPLSMHVAYALTDEVFLDEYSSPATYSEKLKLMVTITSKEPVTLNSNPEFVLTCFNDLHHRLSTSEDSVGRFEYHGLWMRYIDIKCILPLASPYTIHAPPARTNI